jgi:tRNA threonylcarbamoyladenosine biosynthesis protein TsaB
MIILALDTSTLQGGVAVLRDGALLHSQTWSRVGSHGEHLTPAIEECLQRSGVSPSEVTAVGVGHGPGSFTGIRIAINAARALAFANSARTFAFDTTEILVGGVSRKDLPVLALVNAQKNQVFASVFRFETLKNRWERSTPLDSFHLDDLVSLVKDPHLCIGDGYGEYASLLAPELHSRLLRDTDESDLPSPIVLAKMCWDARNQSPTYGWKDLQALYIRASGAEEKQREGGKKQ